MHAIPDMEAFEVLCTNRHSVLIRLHKPLQRFSTLGVLLALGGQRLWWTERQVTVEAGTGDTRGFDNLGDGLIFLIAKVDGIGKLGWIDHPWCQFQKSSALVFRSPVHCRGFLRDGAPSG